MKRFALVFAIVLCFCVFSGCSHEHIPGPEAGCTSHQVCTECDEILVAALGHDEGPMATCAAPQSCQRCGLELSPQLDHVPGPEATCTDPQLCRGCKTELAPALGHKMNRKNACEVCDVQIVPENQKYIKPGRNGALSDDLSEIIPETEAGHYNNNIEAFYSGNVLVCGDYALEYFLPSKEGNSDWADTVNAFAEKYFDINTTALLIPKSCTFNSPEGYTDPYEQTREHIDATYAMISDTVRKADALGVMAEHRDEYLFYRTDHHWTGLGAYYAHVAYCNANEIEPYALDTYETVTKTEFMGTLYNYAGYPSSLEANRDYTVGHFPHTGYSMICGNSGSWFNGVAINADAKSYAGMYINGDNALTVITTENKNGRVLIIFKESYGNAFVPYMIDYYEQIIVVDIRKETKSVESIINEYDVTDALIINNAQAAVSLDPQLYAKVMS